MKLEKQSKSDENSKWSLIYDKLQEIFYNQMYL